MHCQEQETKMLWTAYMYVSMYVCMCVCVWRAYSICVCVSHIQHVWVSVWCAYSMCVCVVHTVCVCVCVRARVCVCVWCACTPLCPTVGERKLRKEDWQLESKPARKKREREGKFLLTGRGSGTHNLCSLSVIIVLGLKKRKVLIVFPFSSPKRPESRSALELGKTNVSGLIPSILYWISE